jgi:hypothetical protein
MPIIANTTSANTFGAVRAQLNSVTKRMNQFSVNESAFYANTITANTSLRLSGTLLANGGAGTSGYYLRTSGTGVYWSPVSGGASWAALTGTNTALRLLDAQKLQVANAAATYQTKAVERAALANTNAYIGTQATRITLVNTNLTGTNTALRTLISDRLQVANAASIYQTKAVERAALANTNLRINLINTNLTGTNTALRLLDAQKLQVANATTLFATKASWTELKATNTAIRALDSAKLQVANAVATYLTKNNPVVTGTLTANGTTGTAGYYLRTSGTGIYWSPTSGGGSSSNAFSTVAVGANVAVAGAATGRLTLVAGSGITIAANPATDTITFTATGGGGTFTGGTITGATTVSDTTASTSNLTGAFKVTGGVGITGNLYVANRIGYAGANTGGVSAVYTYYNAATASLDTVFG